MPSTTTHSPPTTQPSTHPGREPQTPRPPAPGIRLPATATASPTRTTATRMLGEPCIDLVAEPVPRQDELLTPAATAFLTALHVRFAGPRHDLLLRRQRERAAIAGGRDPRFLRATAAVRDDPTWQVAGAGPGLERRHVEITGPTDPKMAINALNSGADVWLADLEDATSPTWANVLGGQLVLGDAIAGRLAHTGPGGKEYRVDPPSGRTPTIVVRPRGWHLAEKHLRYIDRAGHRASASASLVDAGLHLFHHARALVAGGSGPYLYLPKIENHLEARLWDEVFTFAEEHLELAHGTIRATVLIETITAAFEMEEILFELRDHCAGLNAGRWDYIFSIIKTFRSRGSRFVTPDRSAITMTVPPMAAYTALLVDTCHRRGAHAIGGMAAAVPQRDDPAGTARALEAVAADKRREATGGFDGSWVAHPGLIATARAEFDAVLADADHQVVRRPHAGTPAERRAAEAETADRLIDVAAIPGAVTDAGVRANVSVAVRYLDAWLRGSGAVAIDALMEDAATAEISRSQVWQWIRCRVRTVEGTLVSRERVEEVLAEVVASVPRHEGDRVDEAAVLFREVALGEDFPTFLTIAAYSQHLVEAPHS